MTLTHPNTTHQSRNERPHRVLVIGGGVVGITSAIGLREAGFDVTVVAEHYENITSNVAGALWEWPPAVCGQHGDPRSLSSSKHWCMVSYDKFKELHSTYGEGECGVYLQDVFFYFRFSVDKCCFNLEKMNELKDKVDGFARGMHIVPEGVDPQFVENNIKDCYKHMAPMVDTDKYMPWLQQQARDKGCILLQERIDSHVLLEEDTLRKRYKADAIVVSPGLGAIDIVGDTHMYPLRGALVWVKQPNGAARAAHCISHEEGSSSEQDIVFIVPRGKDHVVLGGLAQPNQWDRDLSLDDPIVDQMYKGCLDLLPALRPLELDPKENVRTGLYPFTSTNVLLERIPSTNVVLNYGHGGAGVTLSWGCAEKVVSLVQEMFHDTPHVDNISQKLDASRPTTFLLHDMLPFRAQIEKIRFMKHNLVLISSRRGVAKVPAHEFIHFDLIRVVDSYALKPLVATVSEILSSCALRPDKCRIATNDEYSILLSGQVRDALGIPGAGSHCMLPFFDKNATKKAIGQNGPVRIPNYVVFSPEKFRSDPDGYVREVMDTVGHKLFIKPVVGAGSEKTWRLDGSVQLLQWCEANACSDSIFEIDERIAGELFNTSVVRVDGRSSLFFAMRHNRPNDEYLQGHQLGNIIVPPTDALYAKLEEFSEAVLYQLRDYCEDYGVFNIDFFLESGTAQPVLMEVAARAAGGAVGKVIEECSGVALEETSLLMQMGHKTPLHKFKSTEMRRYAAYSIHPPKAGVVKRMQIPKLDSTISSVSWRAVPGKRLSAPTSMRDIALVLVISNTDMKSLARDFERINSEEYVIVE
ncbi:unnamed protein product [Chondrus crispus]|uniref:ATP-grasp domain-containing protein n=1 Tax=Chondrus crispus TaxID=2769 RepID=R7QCK7_CHOCR|nr:unnamed protein product [Chondrus crispus]CDF35195.1 unnamed protein product [Chondrus crispus]|eukprot:XP_005715014.1 unnamed protein product [Chondrus crispus]